MAERCLMSFDRGFMTLDELEKNLWDAVHSFAEQEFDRAHPEWGTDALFDRNRMSWETASETRRQSTAEAGAAYALALTKKHEHASGLVERVFGSPQWQQALEPIRAKLSQAAADGLESLEAVASTGWLAALRGVLPPAAREPVRGAPLSAETAMIDLLECDREGNAVRVGEIVAAAGQRGCVSPAVHLIRFRRNEGRPVAAAEVAAVLDPKDLAERGEFGGITHMAAELLAGGADALAAEWSSLVDDDRLFHRPEERDRHDLRAHYKDWRERAHGPGWCVHMCNEGDARLLGALAAIDWCVGSEERALVRAAACDAGSDLTGWSAAGVELLARWVLSRRLESTERSSQLLDLIKRSDDSHVDLGLLGVQIHSELAELAEEAGDQDAAAHHRLQAEWFRARPRMRLHFEPFQFPSLLSRLPLL
jgi:hypothetical protein